MLNRIVAVAFLAYLLGGCTDADWDHSLSYVGLDQEQSQSVPVKPVPAEPAAAASVAVPAARTDAWCDVAAKSAAGEARESGFDESTQRRQAELARAQCLHH